MTTATASGTRFSFELPLRIPRSRPIAAQGAYAYLHPTLVQALGLPDLCLARLRRDDRPDQPVTVWLASLPEQAPADRKAPWHRTITVSVVVADALGLEARPTAVTLTVNVIVMPVRPALITRLQAGDEIGMHVDDAATLGIGNWVVASHRGISAALRVRRLSDQRDRGHVRLSYQTRTLLGLERNAHGFVSEIVITPFPRHGRAYAHPPSPVPRQRSRLVARTARTHQVAGDGVEAALRVALRAPAVTLRSIETSPGEDLAISVRLPPTVFPLLHTRPGMPVYLEWGPRRRAVATALEAAPPDESWPEIQHVGPRLDNAPPVPPVMIIGMGAATRADLAVPRSTLVTVRRKTFPLIAGRLNELIVPATGLFLALALHARLPVSDLLLAVTVVLLLLISPLRARLIQRRRER